MCIYTMPSQKYLESCLTKYLSGYCSLAKLMDKINYHKLKMFVFSYTELKDKKP